MLARCLTTLLPPMTLAAAIDTTRIYRVARRIGSRTTVLTTRPCRVPGTPGAPGILLSDERPGPSFACATRSPTFLLTAHPCRPRLAALHYGWTTHWAHGASVRSPDRTALTRASVGERVCQYFTVGLGPDQDRTWHDDRSRRVCSRCQQAEGR
jgi:hypothetical protein